MNKTKHHITFTPDELKPALDYIDMYWHKLQYYSPKDKGSLIGLPYPYFVPSSERVDGFDFHEMYYWDSYFIALGLIGTHNQEHAYGMLENMMYMLERFDKVPNGSRFYHSSRSQPPFMSSLILNLYQLNQNKRWLKRHMKQAKFEYNHVWMGSAQPHRRLVHKGLSRYYDANVLHDLAEAESGWDMTTRFNRRCLHYLPIDLNSLLYKYEMDFAETARILKDKPAQQKWEIAADARREACNYYMWDEDNGCYFDYDYVKEKRGTVWSLAAFYPLWAGMATKEQAQKLVKSLDKFENDGGLVTTLTDGEKRDPHMKTQWAYPNGWAPLHYLVVRGLMLYGYEDHAQRIVRKWLRANLIQFNQTHEFLEKYNVVNPAKDPKTGEYPDQVGFGWTNAIFHRFCLDFLDKSELPKHEGKKLPRRVSLQKHLKTRIERGLSLQTTTKKSKEELKKLKRRLKK